MSFLELKVLLTKGKLSKTFMQNPLIATSAYTILVVIQNIQNVQLFIVIRYYELDGFVPVK